MLMVTRETSFKTSSLPPSLPPSLPAMAKFYSSLCSETGRPLDPALLQELEAANSAELARLEEAIKDAQENLGDTELKDALMARAEYLCRTGDKVGSGWGRWVGQGGSEER